MYKILEMAPQPLAENQSGTAPGGHPDRRAGAGQAEGRAVSARRRHAPRPFGVPAGAHRHGFAGHRPAGTFGPAPGVADADGPSPVAAGTGANRWCRIEHAGTPVRGASPACSHRPAGRRGGGAGDRRGAHLGKDEPATVSGLSGASGRSRGHRTTNQRCDAAGAERLRSGGLRRGGARRTRSAGARSHACGGAAASRPHPHGRRNRQRRHQEGAGALRPGQVRGGLARRGRGAERGTRQRRREAADGRRGGALARPRRGGSARTGRPREGFGPFGRRAAPRAGRLRGGARSRA